MESFRGLVVTLFCFSMLCLTAFVPLPLLSFDFATSSFTPYNYSLLYIVCFALAISFKRNYVTIAAILYLITGLCGLPIFTNGGGIKYLFEPSFGYLLSLVVLGTLSFVYRDMRIAPLAIIIAHLLGLGYLLVTQSLNFSNFLSLSLYQFIYDLIFALILVIILPHGNTNSRQHSNYNFADLKVES